MIAMPAIGAPKRGFHAKCHPLLFGLLGVTLSHISHNSFANTSLDDLLQMDIDQLLQIEVVSLNKRPQQPFDLAASVYVFNRDDIQRTGALTVPDLLLRVPGVYVRQPTKSGNSISIRNDNQFFNANMLLLIDGQAMYSPITNNFQWRFLPVSVEDIERIEVIRGNGGTAWGTNSSAGVINIITRRHGDGAKHELRAGVGNQGYRRIHGATSLHGLRISAHSESDDGFEDNPSNSDFQYANINYANTLSSWELFFSGNYYQHTIENLDTLINQTPQTNDMKSYNLSAEASRRFGERRFNLKTYYSDSKTDYALVGTKNIHQKTADVEMLYFTPLTTLQRLQLGGSYRRYSSDYPGGPIVRLTPSKIEESLLNATVDYENDIHERYRFNLGLRYEDYSLLKKDYYSASARLSHQYRDNTALWLAYNHSYQFPSFSATNVSAIIGVQNGLVFRQQGNSELIAEQYDDIQLGLRHKIANTTLLDLVAHYVKVQDEIFVDPATATTEINNSGAVVTSEFSNHISSNSWGAELLLNHQFNWYYKTELGLTYFRKQSKSQDDEQRPPINGQYAPKWKVTLSNDFNISADASAYLFLNWESAHQYESSSIYLPAESTEERFRVDGNLQLRYSSKLRLDLGFKNMFNQQVDWQYDFITSEPREVEPSYYAHLLYEF